MASYGPRGPLARLEHSNNDASGPREPQQSARMSGPGPKPQWRAYGTDLPALRSKLVARQNAVAKMPGGRGNVRWEAGTEDLAAYISWLEQEQARQAGLPGPKVVRTRLAKSCQNDTWAYFALPDLVKVRVAAHLSTKERTAFFSACKRLRTWALSPQVGLALWGRAEAAAGSPASAASLEAWAKKRRQFVQHFWVAIEYAAPAEEEEEEGVAGSGVGSGGGGSARLPPGAVSAEALGLSASLLAPFFLQPSTPALRPLASDPTWLGRALSEGALRTLSLRAAGHLPLARLAAPKPRAAPAKLLHLTRLEASAPSVHIAPGFSKLQALQCLALEGWVGPEKNPHCMPPTLTSLTVSPQEDEEQDEATCPTSWRVPGAIVATRALAALVVARPCFRVDGLPKLSSLTSLTLACSKDRVPSQLSGLVALRELRLGLGGCGSKGLAPLTQLAALTYCEVSHCNYEHRTEAEYDNLKEGYGSMRCHVPSGLLGLPQLQALVLDSWPIPSPGLEAPTHFPTIQDLSLSFYTATDAPAALRWLTSLTRLRLRRRRAAARRGAVDPAALLELLCALAALPHLEELEWEFEPQLGEVAEGKANPSAASHPLAGPQPAGAGLAAAAALLRRGSPGFPKLRALVLDLEGCGRILPRLESLLGLSSRFVDLPELTAVRVHGAPAVAAALSGCA